MYWELDEVFRSLYFQKAHIMKKFLFCIGLAWLVLVPSLSTAQSEKEFEDSFNEAFKQFKQKNVDEFNAFRDKINQEEMPR